MVFRCGRLEGVYLRNLDLSELMDRARAAVVGQATSILRDDPAADLQYIVLDMPCAFFSLRSLRWARVPCRCRVVVTQTAILMVVFVADCSRWTWSCSAA
jgi:hypothetical protein